MATSEAHLITARASGVGKKSPFNLRALTQILTGLLDVECDREDQRRYLLFVAPLARRMGI